MSGSENGALPTRGLPCANIVFTMAQLAVQTFLNWPFIHNRESHLVLSIVEAGAFHKLVKLLCGTIKVSNNTLLLCVRFWCVFKNGSVYFIHVKYLGVCAVIPINDLLCACMCMSVYGHLISAVFFRRHYRNVLIM